MARNRTFDHAGAFARWASMKSRSLAKLATELGVPAGTIYKVSGQEGWSKRVLAMETAAADKAILALQSSMDEAALDHVRIAQKMQRLGMQALEELGAPVTHSEAVAMLKVGVAMEKSAREMPRAEQHLQITVSDRFVNLLDAPGEPVKMLDDKGEVVDADFDLKDKDEEK